MTHATVFVLMDAGRASYVRPDTMPFVHGLAQRGLRGSLESPPGFAQRTVLFSGRYPDTSGNFSAFVFDPEQSPFAWVRHLGPARALIRPRKLFYPSRMAVKAVSRWTSDCYHTDPAWIPPRYLPFFRPCEDVRPVHDPGALGATSIFDLARAHGIPYRYLAHPVSGNDEEVFRTLVRELRAGARHQFYAAQFSACDQQGHVHGPYSEHMERTVLPDLDRKVAAIHAALTAGYDTWDLVVAGDHGMAPVTRRVDILRALKKAGAEPGKDFVVFVNSTLAVFWWLTERGRVECEAAVQGLPGLRWLGAQERRERRIPTDRRWGDAMLAAEPGTMLWPDYFHVTDSTIVGMHGYLQKQEEGLGMLAIASSNGGVPPGDVGPRSLVDVFPTLCHLLDVPVPATNEGQSLLQRRAALYA